MLCPLCKTDNPSGSKFCNECGIRLPDSDQSDVKDTSLSDSNQLRDTQARATLVSIPTVEQPTTPLRAPSDSLADTAREMGLGYDAQKTGEIDLGAFYDETPDEYRAPQWRPDQTMEMPAIEDKRSERTDYRAPEMPEKRKKAPIVIAVIAVIAVLVGLLGALYAFGVIGGPLVPDVVGMSASAAEGVLAEKGLSSEIKLVKSDDTEGTVLLTDPSARSHIAKGGTVVLHVATPRSIPAITGKTLEVAQKLLKDEGLTSVTIEKVKSDEEENIVLEVSPSEGERVKANTAVTIKVSESYKVPDVSGLTADQAAALIASEGLVAEFGSVYDSGLPEGSVVSVDPAAGSTVKSGSHVTIYVAKDRGKELCALARSALIGDRVINGQSYEVSSVDSVSYAGNDIVQFVVTGRAFTYLDGEKVYGSVKSINGTMQFDSDNNYTIN